MRQAVINIYKYAELSEKAKEKARAWWLDGLESWWEYIYEDAKNIGLKIEEFDTYYNKIGGKFTDDANFCATRIKSEHGEMCETYKTATEFLDNWDKLVAKYSDGDGERVMDEKAEEFDDEADTLEADFLHSILEDYLIILKREYEYQTSEEAIAEAMEANDYKFYENGKIA